MPVPGITVNFDQANPARVYEYLIGGSDYFPADRALAERLMDPEWGHPGLRELARVNRRFVLDAARWVVRMKGVTQFLDLGCGLPAVPSVHAAVRDAAGLAAVCYVDHDPVAAAAVRAAIRDAGPGLAAVEADVSDPAAVLGDKRLLEVIDLDEPVCAVFGGTLSAMDRETAQGAVAGFAGAMAPGSAVIISCVSYGDPVLAARMTGLFGATGNWRNHRAGDIASFFGAGALRVVHGKVMNVSCWPACSASEEAAAAAAAVLGGIAVKG